MKDRVKLIPATAEAQEVIYRSVKEEEMVPDCCISVLLVGENVDLKSQIGLINIKWDKTRIKCICCSK